MYWYEHQAFAEVITHGLSQEDLEGYEALLDALEGRGSE